MNKQKALIFGISGQIGSYLAEYLLEQGFQIYGVVRRSSAPNFWRLENIIEKIGLIEGDVTDQCSIDGIIEKIKPEYIFNFAAQSHVHTSWLQPELTVNVTGLGVLTILEAVRKYSPVTKVWQASSSEQFGNAIPPQDETTPFRAQSPYGAAKIYAHNICTVYRESYNLWVSCGICFNAESPRRSENFVTRKITLGAARIKAGLQEKLKLGNLDAKRDWLYAGDTVKAIWAMMQLPSPVDLVIASGETHTVREFVEFAFSGLGLNPDKYIVIDQELIRPAEVNFLQGNANQLRLLTDWKPAVSFRELVGMMVGADYNRVCK